MNKQRRKEIEKASALISEAQEIVVNCAEEERDYYDEMPENLQGSERGDKASEAADQLEEAADSLGECVDALADATE